MDYVNEIKTNQHVLKAKNSRTKSYGVGMADMGGFPCIDLKIITADKAYEEIAECNPDKDTRYFNLTEVKKPDEEYLLYLKLHKKYGKSK